MYSQRKSPPFSLKSGFKKQHRDSFTLSIEKNIDTSKTKNNDEKLKDIEFEYDQKRNLFYPKDKSPNVFMKKLQLRMKIYYEKCMEN